MPRSNRPSEPHQHDQAQVRAAHQRAARRNWRLTKDLARVEEHTGRLIVDMNSQRVQDACSQKLLGQLADELGQAGPVLFVHPEALRRMPAELRQELEECLGFDGYTFGKLIKGAHNGHTEHAREHRLREHADGGRGKVDWDEDDLDEARELAA